MQPESQSSRHSHHTAQQDTPTRERIDSVVQEVRARVVAWMDAHPDARNVGSNEDGDLPDELQDVIIDATSRERCPDIYPDAEYDEIDEAVALALDPVIDNARETLAARGPALDDPRMFRVYLDDATAQQVRNYLDMAGQRCASLDGQFSELFAKLIHTRTEADAQRRVLRMADEVAAAAWEANTQAGASAAMSTLYGLGD